MPLMLPPGQGVTVTLPPGAVPQQQKPATPSPPPNPFRPARGPDVVLMPHQPEEQGQPQQMGRHGQPMRYGMEDILPLHAALSRNSRDRAHWGILADALDDHGKPALAHVFRQIFQTPEPTGYAPYLMHGVTHDQMWHSPQRTVPDHGILLGHSHGVPWEMIGTRGSPESGYHVRILATGRSHVIGAANIPLEHAKQLAGEMDFIPERWRTSGAQMKRHLGIPEHEPPFPDHRIQTPQTLSRGGKLMQFVRRALKLSGVTADTVNSFVRGMSVPHDNAPHLVFADYLEENGDPRHLIVRKALGNGRGPQGHLFNHRDSIFGVSPPTSPAALPHLEGHYTQDGGWIGWNEHQTWDKKPSGKGVYFRYIPSTAHWEDESFAPDYSTVLDHETAKHVIDHVSRAETPRLPIHSYATAAHASTYVNQPKQMSRTGRPVKLAGVWGHDVEAFARAASVPNDDAPHHVFADYLEDADDPRHLIVREAIKQGRASDGSLASHPSWFGSQTSERIYTKDGGWMSVHPTKGNPQGPVTLRYIPSAYQWENHQLGPDYVAQFDPETAAHIIEHTRTLRVNPPDMSGSHQPFGFIDTAMKTGKVG